MYIHHRGKYHILQTTVLIGYTTVTVTLPEDLGGAITTHHSILNAIGEATVISVGKLIRSFRVK